MPCLVYLVLSIEPGVLSMVGKHSTSPELCLKSKFLLNSNIPTWISKCLKEGKSILSIIQAIAYVLHSPSCSLNAWEMYVHMPRQRRLQTVKISLHQCLSGFSPLCRSCPLLGGTHIMCRTISKAGLSLLFPQSPNHRAHPTRLQVPSL